MAQKGRSLTWLHLAGQPSRLERERTATTLLCVMILAKIEERQGLVEATADGDVLAARLSHVPLAYVRRLVCARHHRHGTDK